MLRTWILGLLEVLRRWQWNFCMGFPYVDWARLTCATDRLENEHLGNADKYRVTREVPLFVASFLSSDSLPAGSTAVYIAV
ncbi:hypothetical protein B0H16DRAFT_882527 [Mycena metata]|uniref:EXS domain-containing protein n=1 Tax=Mycena metata TaxID=1033252 RepID=A0AAD7K4M9_9AGAR|nr:hypothetical protein B0H16DRAFT_882527 [Mycena metata]